MQLVDMTLSCYGLFFGSLSSITYSLYFMEVVAYLALCVNLKQL